MTLAGADLAAAVTAHIVKCAELVRAAADDQITIVNDIVVDVVANLGNIFDTAGYLPELPPYVFHFEVYISVLDIPIEGYEPWGGMNVTRIIQKGWQRLPVAGKNIEGCGTVGNLSTALDSPCTHIGCTFSFATHKLPSCPLLKNWRPQRRAAVFSKGWRKIAVDIGNTIFGRELHGDVNGPLPTTHYLPRANCNG